LTVCIAARAGNVVVAASDRMLTAGDVQFEPTIGSKVVLLTTSIFMMTAGDSAIQAEICSRVMKTVHARILEASERWWLVSEVADLYVLYYNEVRNKRASDIVLSPFSLDHKSFLSEQHMMNSELANNLAKELINYDLPPVETIVAGTDPAGTHIYTVSGNIVDCVDSIGFAAIGSGSRHASSQFMFARHAWNSPFADSLLLTYIAKRKAEVAPGVGIGTDMVTVGPGLGTFVKIGDHVIARLNEGYKEVIESETLAFSHAKEEIRSYVEELTRQAEARTSSSMGQTTSEIIDGGSPIVDPKAARSAEKGEREE
jgi:ATP-dependent protease HslVU (ClpYQ) peptidase subunit